MIESWHATSADGNGSSSDSTVLDIREALSAEGNAGTRREGAIRVTYSLRDGDQIRKIPVDIKQASLHTELEAFEDGIKSCVDLANRGGRFELRGLEDRVAALSNLLKPPRLRPLPSAHDSPANLLSLHVEGPYAQRIPWEAFEEYHCSGCKTSYAVEFGDPMSCTRCGSSLERRKLGIAYQLAHQHVFGRQERNEGRVFLVVSIAYERHIDTVCKLLAELGYHVTFLSTRILTPKDLLSWLSSDDVVGLYYFGHANADAGSAYLELGGHEKISSEEIAKCRPRVPFVFLNACQAAARAVDASNLLHAHSLAEAFGGKGRTVIAPITSISDLHAGKFAEDFLRAALARRSGTVGEYLALARAASLRRCREGSPDPMWALVRSFGSANNRLPAPDDRGIRVFPHGGGLSFSAFCFDMASVVDAALRCSVALAGPDANEPPKLSLRALVLGMVKSGELTRYLLRDICIDPDCLLTKVLHGNELKSLRTAANKPLPSYAFEKEVSDGLVAVDRAAQNGPDGSTLISEWDVLRWLLKQGAWEGLACEDARAADLRARMESRLFEPAKTVDQNGFLHVEDLEPEAKAVIYVADRVACSNQGNRRAVGCVELFVALWLKSPCAQRAYDAALQGQNEKRKRTILDRLSSMVVDQPSGDWRIAATSAGAVVIPLLQEARARGGARINDHDLVGALRRVVDQRGKEQLSKDYLINFDQFRCHCPGQPVSSLRSYEVHTFDQVLKGCQVPTQTVLRRFADLCRHCNSTSNRLFLASFLDQGEADCVPRSLERFSASKRREMSEYLIRRSQNFEREVSSDMIEVRLKAIVEGARAVLVAASRGGRMTSAATLDLETLFTSFWEAAPAELIEGVRAWPLLLVL